MVGLTNNFCPVALAHGLKGHRSTGPRDQIIHLLVHVHLRK